MNDSDMLRGNVETLVRNAQDLKRQVAKGDLSRFDVGEDPTQVINRAGSLARQLRKFSDELEKWGIPYVPDNS